VAYVGEKAQLEVGQLLFLLGLKLLQRRRGCFFGRKGSLTLRKQICQAWCSLQENFILGVGLNERCTGLLLIKNNAAGRPEEDQRSIGGTRSPYYKVRFILNAEKMLPVF
jgi:hypothetical protein